MFGFGVGFGVVFSLGPLRDCDGDCDSDFDDAFTCRNSRMRSGASRWPDYAHDMLIYMRCQSPKEVLLWAIDGHASQSTARAAALALALRPRAQRLAARPTVHPDRYLASGKKSGKYK